MVPPDNAAARSRSRILRLDNIQRGRRYRRPNNPRLYDRDESSVNDGAAGKPGLNHSLTYQSEQFCGKRQPELFSLPENHECHHRPEPGLRVSTNGIRIINAHSIRSSISPAEHLHHCYRWGEWKAKPQRDQHSESGPARLSRLLNRLLSLLDERDPWLRDQRHPDADES